jgi:hypothetical protein
MAAPAEVPHITNGSPVKRDSISGAIILAKSALRAIDFTAGERPIPGKST